MPYSCYYYAEIRQCRVSAGIPKTCWGLCSKPLFCIQVGQLNDRTSNGYITVRLVQTNFNRVDLSKRDLVTLKGYWALTLTASGECLNRQDDDWFRAQIIIRTNWSLEWWFTIRWPTENFVPNSGKTALFERDIRLDHRSGQQNRKKLAR